jgi:hypothetical protein
VVLQHSCWKTRYRILGLINGFYELFLILTHFRRKVVDANWFSELVYSAVFCSRYNQSSIGDSLESGPWPWASLPTYLVGNIRRSFQVCRQSFIVFCMNAALIEIARSYFVLLASSWVSSTVTCLNPPCGRLFHVREKALQMKPEHFAKKILEKIFNTVCRSYKWASLYLRWHPPETHENATTHSRIRYRCRPNTYRGINHRL